MTYNLHDNLLTFFTYLVTSVTIVFMIALGTNTAVISGDYYFVVRIKEGSDVATFSD
jgi:hypothetical protein